VREFIKDKANLTARVLVFCTLVVVLARFGYEPNAVGMGAMAALIAVWVGDIAERALDD
jgi:hypothetical protein